MNFIEAVKAMQEGKKVNKESNTLNQFLAIDTALAKTTGIEYIDLYDIEDDVAWLVLEFMLMVDDFLADDWEIVDTDIRMTRMEREHNPPVR